MRDPADGGGGDGCARSHRLEHHHRCPLGPRRKREGVERLEVPARIGQGPVPADPVADAAKRCAQYYINHRWLGGTLTNWKTISNSIKRLRTLEDMLSQTDLGLTKKEMLRLTREQEKLERALGGIKDMGGIPDLMFVIDTNKEAIAIQEARKLNIPTIAMVDTNSDPTLVDHPIPANDDALKSIQLTTSVISQAIAEGSKTREIQESADKAEKEKRQQEKAAPVEAQA